MKCYIRKGEGDRRCSEAEVGRMLRDRDTVLSDYSAGAEIIPNSGPEDLDPQTLLKYRNGLKRNREPCWSSLGLTVGIGRPEKRD